MDIKKQKSLAIQFGFSQVATLILELFGAYALFYMTTVKLIDPTSASSFISIGTVLAALASIYIGFVADRSKRGKRSIAFAFLVLALVLFVLFFAPIGASGGAYTAYLGVVVVVFYVFYYCFITPFDALGGDLVTDYNVRTLLRTMCMVGIYIGVVIANTLSAYIRGWLTGAGMSESMSWFVMGLIIACVSGVAGLFGWNATKGYHVVSAPAADLPKTNIVKSYLGVLKEKVVTMIFLWSILYYSINMLLASMTLYLGIYVLGLSETTAATLFTVSVVATIIVSPVINAVAAKVGKKVCMIGSMAVYLLYVAYVLLKTQAGFVDGVLFVAAFSIVNVGAQSCSYSMLYDANELVEFKTGESKAAATMGLYKCGMAVGMALGTFILGRVMVFGQFDGAALEQSQQAVDWFVYGVSWIPAVIIVLCIIIIGLGYKINEKNHAALIKALETKKNGGEYSTEEFKELL